MSGKYSIIYDTRNTKLSSIKWHCVCHDDIPKQENLSDCGTFACMFGCCLAYNNPLNFTQQDIPCIWMSYCSGIAFKRTNQLNLYCIIMYGMLYT